MKRLFIVTILGTVLTFGSNGTTVGNYFEETNTYILHGKDGTTIGTVFPDIGIVHESKSNQQSSIGVILSPIEQSGKSSIGLMLEDLKK